MWEEISWLAENTLGRARGYNTNQNTSFKSFLVKAEIQSRSNTIRFPPMYES